MTRPDPGVPCARADGRETTPPHAARIRVLVADNHALVRLGVVTLLQECPDLVVVAEARDGEEAVRYFAEARPDVALLDINMPAVDGVGAVTRIRARFPDATLVVLTAHDSDDDIVRALRAGAKACLLKDADPQDLVACIRAVHEGRSWVAPAVAARLADRCRRPELTPREMDVLRELAEGKSDREIGVALDIPEGTATLHARHVYEKLGVRSLTEALRVAQQRGLLRLPGV